MKIDLSAAQLGVIVHALECEYQDGSDEIELAQELANLVYEQLGNEMYDDWLAEFDISMF